MSINRIQGFYDDRFPKRINTGNRSTREDCTPKRSLKESSHKTFEPNYLGGILAGIIGLFTMTYVNSEVYLTTIDPKAAQADTNDNNYLGPKEADVLVKLHDTNRNGGLDKDEKKKLAETQSKMKGPYLNQIYSAWNLGTAIERVDEFEKMQELWSPRNKNR